MTILPRTNDEESTTVPKVLYENRYCDHDDFNILVCGGNIEYEGDSKTLNEVYKMKGPNFERSKLPGMLKARRRCTTASVNCDVIAVGGYNKKARRCLFSVELFNSDKKSWCYKTELPDERIGFSMCSFMQSLYIVGGNGNGQTLKSCIVYDMKCNKWSQTADMNGRRNVADCVVYEGKIVVSGGVNNNNGLKSVEAYDYYENKWTNLPDMIEDRFRHASASIRNKLFVIGGFEKSACERFDSHSRKFCHIKVFPGFTEDMFYLTALSISNQIIIFGDDMIQFRTNLFTYNVETGEWKFIDGNIFKGTRGSSCVKYHD